MLPHDNVESIANAHGRCADQTQVFALFIVGNAGLRPNKSGLIHDFSINGEISLQEGARRAFVHR